MTVRREVSGLLALAALAAGATSIARFILPSDFGAGLGPRLLTIWWFLGVFVLATLAFGQLLVRRLSPTPRDGAWALAFSSGALSFGVALGLFGWLGWLGYPFFWVLPLTMTLAGLPALRDALAEANAQWRTRAPWSPLETLALLFGGACLLLLGLQVLGADNANFDALWYHLRGAERNALAGAIERTPEGDVLLSLPSLTNWVATWAFLAPHLGVDDRVALALHLELAVFVGTLALVPPLVRALLPGVAARASRATWVALFFFPSVFVYDTGLMGGADHYVALWAAASVLLWLQVRERPDRGGWILFGVQLAGLSAKYSSLYLLVPMVPAVLVDALWRARRHGRLRATLRGLASTAAVVLALTAPYWLRNWVWYHDPVYPAAHGLFGGTPWNEDARAWQDAYELSNAFTAKVSAPGHRVEATLRALLNYHLELYGWKDMIGDRPVMGSGYFLSVLVLPFLRRRRRLLALAVLLHVGVAVWFNTHQHHMRYLTVLTPLMAAGMAATALSLWELGLGGRAGVAGATALLLVASADVPFRRTHRIWNKLSPVENAGSYIAHRGPLSGRLKMWNEVAAALPPAARPLLHGIEPHLGLPRASVTDAVGLQLGINYGRWGSVAQAWRSLREMGVTHLVWSGDTEQPDSVGGEAIFAALARGTSDRKSVHSYNLGELPAGSPPPEPGTHVLYLGCESKWADGIYTIAALSEPLPPQHFPWPASHPVEPATKAALTTARADSRLGWVVLEASCKLEPPPGFTFLGKQRSPIDGAWLYYVR